ncbi:MAG: phosphatase PAP2 family protein [Bdellovibrionota bacterium]
MKRRLWPLAMAIAYVLLIYVLGGLKPIHVVVASLALLDSYNQNTRTFIRYFFPFLLVAIVYDSMRYYYWWGIEGNIRVAEPYHYEKRLFGLESDGRILIPNEYFQIHNWKILDFFCGLAYLTFVFEYVGAGFFLFFTKRFELLKTFGWCFFLVNVMGFATYYIYPAAPPWYVAKYGLGPAQMFISADPAGAARFDALFNTRFFTGMYGQSVDVYGAIPSLHVAYPLLVAWAALVTKRLRAFAIGFYLLMCFSAVYLNHHYIIDIILGTLYAIVALIAVRALQDREIRGAIPLPA